MVLTANLSGQAFAQTTNEETEAPTGNAAIVVNAGIDKNLGNVAQGAIEYHMVPVKNVAPDVIAWWMDPVHNAEPSIFVESRQMQGISKTVSTKVEVSKQPEQKRVTNKRGGVFDPPEGVDLIVPLNEQKALLVRGTEEGTHQVETIVNFLDQPLRSIEIEAKVVEINWEDLKQLPFDHPALDRISSGGMSAGEGVVLRYARDNFDARLADLVQQNKAKVTDIPRVTATNNLAASLELKSTKPAVVTVKGADGQFKPLPISTQDALVSDLAVASSSAIVITPTINNDDTVTMVLQPTKILRLISDVGKPNETILRQRVQNEEIFNGVQKKYNGTVVNVKDNNTMAWIGLSPTLFTSDTAPAAPADKNDQAKVFVLLITSHIKKP